MEAILGKLTAWIGAIIPAAIGSLLSIYVSKEKTSKMEKWELFAIFMFGISLAHFLGGAAIEYSDLNAHSFIADAVKLTIGLLGMATLTNVMTQLPFAVEALRKKWIG